MNLKRICKSLQRSDFNAIFNDFHALVHFGFEKGALPQIRFGLVKSSGVEADHYADGLTLAIFQLPRQFQRNERLAQMFAYVGLESRGDSIRSWLEKTHHCKKHVVLHFTPRANIQQGSGVGAQARGECDPQDAGEVSNVKLLHQACAMNLDRPRRNPEIERDQLVWATVDHAAQNLMFALS